MTQSSVSEFAPVIVVPVYDQVNAIEGLVRFLAASALPVILVDDGSHADCAELLDRLACRYEQVRLIRHAQNKGKGGAVITAMTCAANAGFTHALQIDADGQHDSQAVSRFFDQAREHPQSLICGYPVYDSTVPLLRLRARKIGNWWVKFNSGDWSVRDSMCGFRVYPLAQVTRLLEKTRLSQRMAFDPEILVRLLWMGVPLINLPVSVTYPADGVSHFRAWRDNLLLSKTHARLCCEKLLRGLRRPGRCH